jgi:hypothetical protein
VLVAGLVVGVLGELDRLRDALDAPEAGVPGRADVGELGDGPSELGLIDPEMLLAAGDGGVNQADPVEDDEVLRHRLTGHRQVLAQAGRSPAALAQQQVEHAAPGRVADRRPEVVVHHHAHAPAPSLAAYADSRGR